MRIVLVHLQLKHCHFNASVNVLRRAILSLNLFGDPSIKNKTVYIKSDITLIKIIFSLKPLSIFTRERALQPKIILDMVTIAFLSRTTFHHLLDIIIIYSLSVRPPPIHRKNGFIMIPVLIDLHCLCIWIKLTLTISRCQIGSFFLLAFYNKPFDCVLHSLN